MYRDYSQLGWASLFYCGTPIIILVAEWPPFGQELLTRFTICFLCTRILTYRNLSYFPFWGFYGDSGSNCSSSWCLLTCYF